MLEKGKNLELKRNVINDLITKFDSDKSRDSNEKNKLVEKAIQWCLVNGFVVVPKYLKPTDLMCVTYLPFTLFPTPFKKNDFDKVIKLQPDINLLVSKIASSHQLIEKSLDKYNQKFIFLIIYLFLFSIFL